MSTSPTFGSARGPIVDEKGQPTAPFMRQLNLWRRQLANGLSQIGELVGRVPGRNVGLPAVVQNLTDNGIVNSLDNVNDGVVHGRTLQTALTANQVDLSKVGVVGQVGSAKIVQNVMYNYSNNATVDSIDNGTNATIRVYGPGGVGTSWHQFIGAVIGPEIPAFAGTAAYSTDYYVYYDGSYHITTAGADTLPDGILFSGALHTVAAGGAGGTGGGGGAGGGGGGNQRK